MKIRKPERPQGLRFQPIAICGAAVRLPGGICNPDQLWEAVAKGKDMRESVPPDRYNIHGFTGALGDKNAIKSTYGYFTNTADMGGHDVSRFPSSKDEVSKLDPQQSMTLEVAKECLDDAGMIDYAGERIAVIVGTSAEDWLRMLARDTQNPPGHVLAGGSDFLIPNRVSYHLELRGPSFACKSGCSASLVALDAACIAIQRGQATSAVVVGTSLLLEPHMTQLMTIDGIISAEGSCKVFDSQADGFARADGIAGIFIKPLDAALRDGNPIRVVIRGTGTNSDGRSGTIMMPSAEAQEELMRMTYAEAGLDPHETAYVECHGTGTPVGDPIETQAVGRVFGKDNDGGIYIGSIKGNVGHTEAASGIVGIIKAMMALKHQVIPPHINFNNPNPRIPFAEFQLKVPLELTPFPPGRAQRISVNSFGVGGSNAHVIVEAYHGKSEPENGNVLEDRRHKPELLLFSASTQLSLERNMDAYHEYARGHLDLVPDIAHTLARRRETLQHRAFSVVECNPGGELAFNIVGKSEYGRVPAQAPDITMIFTGQGAQWAQMGSHLILRDERFKADLGQMNTILQSLKHPPSWNVLDELQKPCDVSNVHAAQYSQPLCTVLQIALFHRFLDANVKPVTVIGHSSGEIAAAYAANLLSLEAAIVLAYYRGYIADLTSKRRGSMAAVTLGSRQIAPFLRPGVVVACENSPASTTISGDEETLQKVVRCLKQNFPEMHSTVLKVNVAYHSHHMIEPGYEYARLVEEEMQSRRWSRRGLRDSSGVTRPADFISSVYGKAMGKKNVACTSYWQQNLTSPVLFATAVGYLLETREQNGVFLEIGPHRALAGPLRQTCNAASRSCDYLTTLIRGEDCSVSLLSAFGNLFQRDMDLNLEALFPSGKTLAGLPPYSWDHSSIHWYESRLSKEWRFRKYPHHCLLGSRVLESSESNPSWRIMLSQANEPWIADHKIQGNIVFPLVGYVAMAGEAIRQITNNDGGYRVKDLVVHTALVLSNADGTEMITSLSRHKLTDHEESLWFRFSISSCHSGRWTVHCEGYVKDKSPDDRRREHAPPPNALPRYVNESRFYDALSKRGITYGPSFKLLKNVRSAICNQCHEASAEVQLPNDESANYFALHPAFLDGCFQTTFVAFAHGLGRNLTKTLMPTKIGDIEVLRPASDISKSVQAINVRASGNWTDASIRCITKEGKEIFSIRGAQFTVVEDGRSVDNNEDVHAGAQLVWRPDIDNVPIAPLIRPPPLDREGQVDLEKYTLLCILETAEKVRDLKPCEPFFHYYRQWLQREVERASFGINELVKTPQQLVGLSVDKRRTMKEQLYASLSAPGGTDDGAMALTIKRVCDNAEDIFTGDRAVLELLTEGDTLAALYGGLSFDYSAFVRLLAHAKPTLRILEVGAGTGATTARIIEPVLDTQNKVDMPPYSSYTFTDVSPGFFPEAKSRFQDAPNMEYKVFDVSEDPFSQGFEASSYDVVLAANVLHATPSLHKTLTNLQLVLKPGGFAVITELCCTKASPGFIFGTVPGWWAGRDDGREWEPFVSVDQWDAVLKATGFTGVDTVIYDEEHPYNFSATIVSRKQTALLPDGRKSVTVLSQRPDQAPARLLVDFLSKSDWRIDVRRLGDELPSEQDIICCLDLETDFFLELTKEELYQYQRLLKALRPQQNLLWLSRPMQVGCKDPQAALGIGAAKTARSELGVRLATLEIDERESRFPELVVGILQKMCRQAGDKADRDQLNADFEYAVVDGVVCTGRYHPFSLRDELTTASTNPTSPGGDSSCLIRPMLTRKRVDIGRPGLMDTVRWIEEPMSPELESDHVEIDVRCVGLNFRDVVLANGMLSLPGETDAQLGAECTGVVARVGRDVRGLAVGDRVMALNTGGLLASRVVLPSLLVSKMPANASFEEAATIPACFGTAVRAICKVGGVTEKSPDLKVLIHSACGGVGLAAVQLCKYLDLQIFATVSTPEKIQHLVDVWGIPRSHIFHSRDDSFVDGIMDATGGRGVDLVLNSLAGELLHASWKCVAPFGTMIELGKRDVAGGAKLDMRPFLANGTYSCVDMAQIVRERPDIIHRLLKEPTALFEDARLKPIESRKVFGATEIHRALLYFQEGKHIGKILVRLDDKDMDFRPAQTPRKITFEPDVTYLLVGGTGGLGRSIATWMAERGARSLSFLSRSAGHSLESQQLRGELEAMGCTMTTISGRVEEVEDVRRATRESEHPIGGVLQLAMVLKDSPLADVSWEDWNTTIMPKVHGTLNLHYELADQPLAFFWLASSLVTVVDQIGQANYSAANMFLESFAQYRHHLGLPASVLNISPIDGVGYVAENKHAQRSITFQGMGFSSEAAFLDALELSLLKSCPRAATLSPALSPPGTWSWTSPSQVIMGLRSEMDLHKDSSRTNWRHNRRMGFYHNRRAGEKAGDESLGGLERAVRRFVEQVASDPSSVLNGDGEEEESVTFLWQHISKKARELMLRENDETPVDPNGPLAALGIDSLVGVEMTRWMNRAFSLQMTVLEVMQSGTVKELARLVADKLRLKYLSIG